MSLLVPSRHQQRSHNLDDTEAMSGPGVTTELVDMEPEIAFIPHIQ